MDIKTLEELQAADERALVCTPLGLGGRMKPEDAADFQQRVIARLTRRYAVLTGGPYAAGPYAPGAGQAHRSEVGVSHRRLRAGGVLMLRAVPPRVVRRSSADGAWTASGSIGPRCRAGAAQ